MFLLYQNVGVLDQTGGMPACSRAAVSTQGKARRHVAVGGSYPSCAVPASVSWESGAFGARSFIRLCLMALMGLASVNFPHPLLNLCTRLLQIILQQRALHSAFVLYEKALHLLILKPLRDCFIGYPLLLIETTQATLIS